MWEELNDDDPVVRAGAAAVAGVRGDADARIVERLTDLARHDADAAVRGAALGALTRLGETSQSTWDTCSRDAEPSVRRRACEVAPEVGLDTARSLIGLLHEGDPLVAEAAAFALGELAEEALAGGAVAALGAAATGHADPIVREAAVAALGALGSPSGLDAVLEATHDRPPVRRRAVLALAAFDGDAVEGALREALKDRDWQVRQAAEDLLGPDATMPDT